MTGKQSSGSVWLAGGMQAALRRRARTQMEARSVVQSLGALPVFTSELLNEGTCCGAHPVHTHCHSWQNNVSKRCQTWRCQACGEICVYSLHVRAGELRLEIGMSLGERTAGGLGLLGVGSLAQGWFVEIRVV